MALLDRPLALVGEVVSRAGKRVDRGHVVPHVPRHQPRRDREVLVVRPGIAGTRRVGRGEIYHSISGTPAR